MHLLQPERLDRVVLVDLLVAQFADLREPALAEYIFVCALHVEVLPQVPVPDLAIVHVCCEDQLGRLLLLRALLKRVKRVG